MIHNLTENVPDAFRFQVGEYVYKMTYPTSEELQEFIKLPTEDEQLKFIDAFIKGEDPKAPKLRKALAKHNIIVMNRYNAMITKEFQRTE